MPCGNQNSRCVFVFDVSCFDEVNQKKSGLWVTTAAAPSFFILTDTNPGALFISLFIPSFILFALSSLFLSESGKTLLGGDLPVFAKSCVIYHSLLSVTTKPD